MSESPIQYVIVRLDVPLMQQVLHAIHVAPLPFVERATVAAPLRTQQKHIRGLKIFLCAVDNVNRLKEVMGKLIERNVPMHGYYAPSLEGELTGAASGAVYNIKPFEDLKLYVISKD